MCCPVCERKQLHVSVPAMGDQEPVMSCGGCGAHLTSDVLGLFMDQEPEAVEELYQRLKAA